ncbi:ABC transporter substrate-binding protein [Ideonella sp.]|uniref:ABC transporter substrate-binding protein n=1 Tax=Ideonella sp. TaxID=1929293 RepID=UPI003BB5D8DE
MKLGQSVPLTGPAQFIGIEYQRGLQLAFDAANADGGVRGQRIELISYDDAYEPAQAASNTQDLLRSDGVMALVGYVGTESINRALPMASKEGVPFLAPLTGADALRQQPSRWLQLMRPGLQAECGLIARNLATIGFTKVGVLVQNDPDGEAGLAALEQALQQAGLPAPMAVGRVTRHGVGQEELMLRETKAAARILFYTGPAAVVCLAAYPSSAAVLKSLREMGYRGGVYATSLAGAAAIATRLGPHTAGLSVTQVLPSPYDTSRPMVANYQQKLKASGTAAPDYLSLEGWVAGSLIVEGLRRMPKGGGRAQLMQAMDALGGLDLGGLVMRWDGQRRQLSSEVSLTVLEANGRPRR